MLRYVCSVAQICNLSVSVEIVASREYFSDATGARLCQAVPHSVSQNWILRHVGKWQRARTFGRSADYKSAIRQIANLRYEAALRARQILLGPTTSGQTRGRNQNALLGLPVPLIYQFEDDAGLFALVAHFCRQLNTDAFLVGYRLIEFWNVPLVGRRRSKA